MYSTCISMCVIHNKQGKREFLFFSNVDLIKFE